MAVTGSDELIYDPIGHVFDNVYGAGAYGGHTDHVHLALQKHPRLLLSLLLRAQQLGLRVGENPYFDPVDPVHTEGSWHYQNFGKRFQGKTLGKAADVSGSAALMARFFNIARKRLESGNPIGYALRNAGYQYGGGGGRGGGGGGPARGGGGGQARPQPVVINAPAVTASPQELFQRLLAAGQPDSYAAPGQPNPAQLQSASLAAELAALRRGFLQA